MQLLWGETGEIILRSVISMIALFLLAKIIGPRQIGQLTFYDYILGITAGSVAGAFAIDTALPLWGGLFSLAVFGGASVAMSEAASKSIFCRRLFTGTPEILFYKGNFLEDNLRKNKLDINDVTGLCRSKGYFDLNDLEYIILETNGVLSFLPRSEKAPLTPKDLQLRPSAALLSANVIIDGNIMENHLRSIGKDTAWLLEQLRNEDLSVKEVLLATADENGRFKAYTKGCSAKKTDLFD